LDLLIWDAEFNLFEIYYINLINIAEYTHNHIHEQDCNLYHTKNVYDYCVHIAQEYEELFACADYVLIERQPPTGLCHVEQILFGIFRDKVILILFTNFINFRVLNMINERSRVIF